ncbi:Crp/Fnr family transcriptional regulator [Pelistega sp. NLN82]|uniref:Crp/Fnr family transcriptional regulator n=1 Tax=Pelistega ratti TaxID=2652177 RepID=A0A6L9Y4I3_9BURK|nr:Crp/Fnr family transcriptional regulator [Pelistega ratti]NEN75382.1 Crp/Fnr family transcriptional regulator [Pelistega ratti]
MTLLRKHSLFSQYPPEFYEVLLHNSFLAKVAAGKVICTEGDEASQYFLVAEGSLEMFRYSMEGEERVFSIFEKGQVVAHAAMFMPHGKYPMNARAREDVILYCLDRQSLHKACHQYPALAIRLLSIVSMNMYEQINQVHLLTSSSATERLAYYFIQLRKEQGDRIIIPVTQKQLAAQLGIRAETLNRLLSEWQQKQYIQGKRKEWEILDVEVLSSFANTGVRSF